MLCSPINKCFQDIQRTQNELNNIFKDLNNKLIARPDVYLPALQSFIQKYKKNKTDANAASALYNFGNTLNGKFYLSSDQLPLINSYFLRKQYIIYN